MSAMVITLFLNQFTISIIKKISKFQLIILVFIALNLVFYSITPFWDKYYVMMGVFIPLLLNENKNSAGLDLQSKSFIQGFIILNHQKDKRLYVSKRLFVFFGADT
jgi:hypothetical protein